MAKSQSITLTLRLTGARETLAAFNALGPDANKALKDANQAIADDLAGWIRSAGEAHSSQARAVAGTTKANRDRVPAVTIGGAKKVASSRVPAWALLFGSNFGAYPYISAPRQGRAKHFTDAPAGKGNDYWIFKTAEANQSAIDTRWNKAADEVARRWATIPPEPKAG